MRSTPPQILTIRFWRQGLRRRSCSISAIPICRRAAPRQRIVRGRAGHRSGGLHQSIYQSRECRHIGAGRSGCPNFLRRPIQTCLGQCHHTADGRPSLGRLPDAARGAAALAGRTVLLRRSGYDRQGLQRSGQPVLPPVQPRLSGDQHPVPGARTAIPPTLSTGGLNGAKRLVATGTLDMRSSTIQTQQGGNITIMGPGGRSLVGRRIRRRRSESGLPRAS